MAKLQQPLSLQRMAVLCVGSIFSQVVSTAMRSSKTVEELEKDANILVEFLDLYVNNYLANEILTEGARYLSSVVRNHAQNSLQLRMLRTMTKGIMMKNMKEVSLKTLPSLLWESFWNNLGRMSGLQILKAPYSLFVHLSQDVLWVHLPHLQYLKVVSIPGRGCRVTLRLLAQHCPNLTELDVHHSRYVDDVAVQPLGMCLKLKVLFLFSTGVTAKGFAYLICTLPSLRHLGECVLLDKVLEELGHSSCPPALGLTKMYLRDVSAEKMKKLACVFPQLNRVGICLHNEILQSFDGLERMSKLNQLMLSDMHFYQCGIGEMLKIVGPRLKLLHLVNMTEVNGDAFGVIWRTCHGLQELAVHTDEKAKNNTENPLKGMPSLHQLLRLTFTMKLSPATQLAILSCSPSLRHLAILHPSENVIIEAAESGFLSYLQEFFTPSNPHLTLDLVLKLLMHCPNLCRIGYVMEWQRMPPSHLMYLRRHLQETNRNVDLYNRKKLSLANNETATSLWLTRHRC